MLVGDKPDRTRLKGVFEFYDTQATEYLSTYSMESWWLGECWGWFEGLKGKTKCGALRSDYESGRDRESRIDDSSEEFGWKGGEKSRMVPRRVNRLQRKILSLLLLSASPVKMMFWFFLVDYGMKLILFTNSFSCGKWILGQHRKKRDFNTF